MGGNNKGHQPLATAAAGAVATLASDAVNLPLDVVKQRLQVRGGPCMICAVVMTVHPGFTQPISWRDWHRQVHLAQRGCRCIFPVVSHHSTHHKHCTQRCTYHTSLHSQVLMNVPFTAVHFTVYESAKKMLRQEEDETLLTQLSAGGLAGGCAAAVTNPLDVVKTRLQLEGVGSATKYRTTAVVRRG